jgi:hypothetical protein
MGEREHSGNPWITSMAAVGLSHLHLQQEESDGLVQMDHPRV